MSPLSQTPSAVASNRMAPTLGSRDIGATWIAPALTFAAAAFSVVLAPGPRGVLGAALALLMGAIAVADLRHFIIPNIATAPAFLLWSRLQRRARCAGVGQRARWRSLRCAVRCWH